MKSKASQIRRYITLSIWSLLSLSCVNNQVLTLAPATKNPASSVSQTMHPCIVSVIAPETLPGRKKAIIDNPFYTEIYFYPLKPVLQSSFENSVYTFFSPPGSQIMSAFSVKISPLESKLELTSSSADYTLCCQITLLDPNEKTVFSRTVKLFEKSAFDGHTLPPAIQQAADKAAEECLSFIKNEKRLFASQWPSPVITAATGYTPSPVQQKTYTAEEFKIKHYQYDARSHQGTVAVDIGDKGFQARLWVVKNIGAVCSSKNVTLEAGAETFEGAKYRVLDETIEEGLLTIRFEATY